MFGRPPADQILDHGDIFDYELTLSTHAEEHPTRPDVCHACAIRGSLDTERLRHAIDTLQERHPRLRAKLHENMRTGYCYLLKNDARIPLDIRNGSYATINTDIERELMTRIDAYKGPFCRFVYIQHQGEKGSYWNWMTGATSAEDTCLLMLHQNGVLGNCCDILLSQVLKLYEGMEVPYCFNTKSIFHMRQVDTEKMTKWHYIEAQRPIHSPNDIYETFVDPFHPAFQPTFDGVCLELFRLDRDETERLEEVCKNHQTTMISAVAASVAYAVMEELVERNRVAEFVCIGEFLNERGYTLGPEFDEECGMLNSDLKLNFKPQASFWETASGVADFKNQVRRDGCAYEAMLATIGEMQHVEAMMLLSRATNDHIVAITGGMEHVNMTENDIRKRFSEVTSIEVQEYFAMSHMAFIGGKVEVCTNALGNMTLCLGITRNVVPHARELACKLRDRIGKTLLGVLAEEGSPRNEETLQWCSEVASAMQGEVGRRRAKLSTRKKSRDGIVYQGDVSGKSSTKTHVKLVINFFFAVITGGGLAGYPIYEPELKKAGVFNHVCSFGMKTCPEQDAALSDMFQFATFFMMALSVFAGYMFDVLGAQRAAVAGGILASVSMFVVGCAICLDAQAFPTTQVSVLYSAYIVGDIADLLGTYSLLGWMWHYPLRQTLIIGLQNGAAMGSSMFGILFVWMVTAGFQLHSGFFVVSATNLVGALAFYICTPSKQEYFKEAGKVLNRHVESLDAAAFAGYTHFKWHLKCILGIMKLFPLENCLCWFALPLATAAEFWWLGGFAIKYERWFGDDSMQLLSFFASVYSPLGIILNPAFGYLLDVIGFRSYLFVVSLVLLCVSVLVPVQTIAAQKFYILMLSVLMGISQNINQKFCVLFGPPHLFGTWLGLSLSFMGLGSIFVDIFLDSDEGVTILMVLSALLMLSLVALFSIRGIPKQPPRSMFDSPSFLRGLGP